jgi:hypothetical protein
MLSSLRLAIARPAFMATRAFSATPRVADDLFVRPSRAGDRPPPAPCARCRLGTRPELSEKVVADWFSAHRSPGSQMRGIPFTWERADLEEFIRDSGIKAERVSMPASDRRASTRLAAAVAPR